MNRRSIALFTLASLTLSIVIAILYDPSARVQGWVGGEPFYSGRSATAWERDLKSTDDATRATAVTSLSSGKENAVPMCVWVLQRSPSESARVSAADALNKMGKDARPAAAELVATLADPSGNVKEIVITAVGNLAPNVPGAVPALVKLFPKDRAIRAVGEFKQGGAEAVPALLELLNHPEVLVRWNAARTLGKIGEPALPAVPGLLKQLESDPDPLVQEHAAEALGDIGVKVLANTDVIPALAKALKNPDQRVRRDSVRSLGTMGAAAKPVLADIKTLITDPVARVKEAAVEAVKKIESAPVP